LAALAGLFALTTALEAVGGWWTGSLALLADAGHLMGDVAALLVSAGALWLAQRPPRPRYTYGYHRAEILAALGNAALLVPLAVWIVLEALERLRQPPTIFGPGMAAIAAVGLGVNLFGLALLHPRRGNLNLRSAWLHLVGDVLGSVAALVAAALVLLGARWADPAVSLLLAGLLLLGAWNVGREAVAVLLEAAPPSVDPRALAHRLADVPGVRDVHDVHVWTIASGRYAVSAHAVVEPGGDAAAALAEMHRRVGEEFHLDHVTIQIEPPGFAEGPACAPVRAKAGDRE
jgi:cobalt-zinc-cadmium efflux system protein